MLEVAGIEPEDRLDSEGCGLLLTPTTVEWWAVIRTEDYGANYSM
jgi:hypothetical protein